MIDVKGLKKNFGEIEVLKGIDEHIEKGEKVVIIGPSVPVNQLFCVALTLWKSLPQVRYFLRERISLS